MKDPILGTFANIVADPDQTAGSTRSDAASDQSIHCFLKGNVKLGMK